MQLDSAFSFSFSWKILFAEDFEKELAIAKLAKRTSERREDIIVTIISIEPLFFIWLDIFHLHRSRLLD